MLETILKMGIAIVLCVICVLLLRLLNRKLSKKKTGLYINFANSLLNVIFIAICIFYCLSLFEETAGISSTIMKSSALLLAIATFAAQKALGNVFSGFFLAFSRPYDIGEKIKVKDGANIVADGIVKDITIRHTVINTFDGQSLIIPNSVMDASVIVNANYDEEIGNIIDVSVSKSSDCEKAMQLISNVVLQTPEAINIEKSVVTVSKINDKTITLKVPVWSKTIEDNFKACSDIRLNIVKTFRENGIE